MNDADRDAWLREALRHAPDSEALPPRGVSEAILAEARAAARGEQGLPQRRAARARPATPLAGLWSWLARPPVAAGFASVMVATLVGLMWWDRPMDEAMPRRPDAVSEPSRATTAPSDNVAAPAATAAPPAQTVAPPARDEESAAANAVPANAVPAAPRPTEQAKVAAAAADEKRKAAPASVRERAALAERQLEAATAFPAAKNQSAPGAADDTAARATKPSFAAKKDEASIDSAQSAGASADAAPRPAPAAARMPAPAEAQAQAPALRGGELGEMRRERQASAFAATPLASLLAGIAGEPARWSRTSAGAGAGAVVVEQGWRDWLRELDRAAAGRWRPAAAGASAELGRRAPALELVGPDGAAVAVRLDDTHVRIDGPSAGEHWEASLPADVAERLRTAAARLPR